jgi:hypothetical protein
MPPPPLPGCHGLASKPPAWDIVERFKNTRRFSAYDPTRQPLSHLLQPARTPAHGWLKRRELQSALL